MSDNSKHIDEKDIVEQMKYHLQSSIDMIKYLYLMRNYKQNNFLHLLNQQKRRKKNLLDKQELLFRYRKLH